MGMPHVFGWNKICMHVYIHTRITPDIFPIHTYMGVCLSTSSNVEVPLQCIITYSPAYYVE